MENQIIQINLVPNMSTPAVVRVSQYDVGRPLVFKVYDGTSPADLTGVTAVIEGTKKSGLGFSESGTVTDNTVTLNTTLAMTQEDGSIPAEIRFSKTGEDVGTANFILAVEKTPHADGTTDGTQETMANLETRLQAEIDDLSDRIDDIEAGGSGLSSTEKQLILTLFSKAAYAEDDAGTAYDALENLWTTTTRTITYNLSHVSSSNSTASIENGQSYTTTLTASTDYTLNTVTVTMGGVDITSTAYSSGTVSIPSVTGNIVITATAILAAQSITATYTQTGTVYTTDSLDSLKTDLVVTANYAGGTSETVPSSDYTLSGTLTAGTSTITVSYAGLTDTFDVTVSAPDTSLFNWDFTQSLTDSKSGNVATLNGSASRDGNGIHLTSSAPDFVTFGTNIYGADRTYELDITSLSMGSISNFARIFMLKNGNYNNCGFLFCGQATRGYSIYNGNGWSWISSTDTDLTKIQGKTLKIYIDSSKYWHVYIDSTLILESTAVVNGAAGTDTSNNAITLGSSNTNSLDYNMVITGLRVYEGVV